MVFHALERHANAVNGVFHARPGRHLQPQLAGNVVDPRRVQRQTASVDGGNEVFGMLLGWQGLATVQEFLEPVHGFAMLEGKCNSMKYSAWMTGKMPAHQFSLNAPAQQERSLQ